MLLVICKYLDMSQRPQLVKYRSKLEVCLYQVGQKTDTSFNYVNIMPYKLQNTRYWHCLSNFNIGY